MCKRWMLALWLGFLLPSILLQVLSRSQTGPQPEAEQPAVRVLDQGQVLQLPMEEYVLSVVLAEMPASFRPEALKAQAVVARTYLLRRQSLQDKHTRAGVCTSPDCCQGYCSREDYLAAGGSLQDVEKVERAVAQTAGQVLTYRGELIEAVYFACSGGSTEAAVAVWGAQVPYLQAVESPGEEKAHSYSTQLEFTRASFAQLLQLPDNWTCGDVTFTDGGGVDTLQLGQQQFTGVQLRSLLQLPSTAFTIAEEGDRVIITCRGHGHRVGMSQYGAEAMAAAGADYTGILAHYYQATELVRWSPAGD